MITNLTYVLIINAYIKSLFNYCPLVWMFCYRGIVHKMNKMQERSLWYQDLLRSSGDISIHQRYINSLLTEVYKYIHCRTPEIMSKIFSARANSYIHDNLMFSKLTYLPRTYMVWARYLNKANKFWNLLPENLRSSLLLTLSQEEIKLWEYFNCPCEICKGYVSNLGYCVSCN